MQDFVGKHIDRYRIIAWVGQGGMAAVYHAQDTLLGRDAALKLIRMGSIPVDHHLFIESLSSYFPPNRHQRNLAMIIQKADARLCINPQ